MKIFMAKTREQKESELQSLVESLANPQVVLFTQQSELSVNDTAAWRNQQKEIGSKVLTVKKTLLKKALSEKGLELPFVKANGLITVVINDSDAVKPSKLLAKTSTDKKGLEILGGMHESKMVDAAYIKQLATLPTFEEAIAQFMFGLRAVGNKLAGTMDAMRAKMAEANADEKMTAEQALVK